MTGSMRLLRAYRLPEAFIVAGFTVVGTVMAAPNTAALLTPQAIIFSLASYLVIVSIYAFNSWGGLREDLANPRLAAAGLDSGGRYAAVSAAALIGALALFAFLRPAAIPYALMIFLFWGIYSFPRYGAKYVPVAGTLVHIAVGITQFQQGWLLFGEPGMRPLLPSIYFALILSAGHVNHELIDYRADREAGIVSGAARFGVGAWTLLHFGVALAALFLLGALAVTGNDFYPRILPFLAASFGHTLSAAFLLGGTPAQNRFLRHRSRYRVFYAAAGLIYLAGRPYA